MSMNPNEPAHDQGRIFPLLRGVMTGRTLTARRAAAVISAVTVILTVVAGVVIWLVDQSFTSVADGLWWAVQTLTTVGYGDVVPESTTGRLIATVVMLNGIALLTVITAAVTATLIDQMRSGRGDQEPEGQAPDSAIVGALDDIRSRLEAIEASMSTSRRDRG
jgi:voltage-gated potassium channel